MAKLKAGGKNPRKYTKEEGLKLFNKTKYNPRKAEHVIKKDKQLAVFIPLAMREKNAGWIRVRPSTYCVNIPDEEGKNFTQYALKKPLPTGQSEKAAYALFVEKKDGAGYEFYGVFSRKESTEDEYSTYFKWKSDELELDEWQKE